MKIPSLNLDLVGFWASFLCAIHCIAVPVLLALGSLSGASWLHNPILEWSLILFSLFIASWSLFRSYFRAHHRPRPLQLAFVGFLFIIIGRLLDGNPEHYATAIAGFCIAAAHLINWRLLSASPSRPRKMKVGRSKAA